MSTQGDSSPGSHPGRARRVLIWARRAPAKRVGGPVGGFALLVSAAFGGLAPVPNSYAGIDPDETVHAGPFDVTVLKVQAVDDLKPHLSPDAPQDRLLAVVMKVRNPTSQPVFSVLLAKQMKVRLDGAEVVAQLPGVSSIADMSNVSEFQPDLTYRVAVIYETRGSAVPRRATVTLPGYTWREDSFTAGFFDWKDPAPIARGSYPVEDLPPLTATGAEPAA